MPYPVNKFVSAHSRALGYAANRIRVVALVLAGACSPALAHHNTQTEFGPFGSETIAFEAAIIAIRWANPHITMDVEITGGELEAGRKMRLVSHPVHIQEQYGFSSDEFAIGDSIRVIGWTHLKGQPLFWPRAVQVNDGPMKSNLRFTDMIDIVNGTFEAMNILPAANLPGSPPGRAGQEAARKLGEMGLLDEDGLMIWPPPE